MNGEITFGQSVKERRELLGLTQAELGRRVGCAAITIRRIEADNLRPSVQIAEHLAIALGVPEADYLAFIRLARANREPSPLPTPAPIREEIGQEDLSGRAIRGYHLGERIGSGGYGVVYRATQATVNREVAVKIILPQYADRPEFIRRFEAEAQLVARLEHPHIVPLYDYWREPGVAYLVMRLLRGGSLAAYVKGGPLAPDRVLPWLEQICAGLHAAHQAGVIHRDIKPANILLDDAGNAYLADFGIAKILSNGHTGETMEGMVVGSPAYISPEQILVEPVRPQSDIYSLGVTLFELLAGRKPFDGPTPFALIQQHLSEPFPPLAAHCPDLPPLLDSLIQRATAKDQTARYADVLSLLADFRQALAVGDRGRETGAAILPGLPSAVSGLALAELTNPYKGLRSFGEADAADFFGREMLVQELLAHLAETSDLARFLAVVGPSGSGKSSVVRAGLLPALRQGGLPGSDQWFIIEMLPGTHPWEELEAALLRIAVNPPESLLAQLREDERGLLRAVRRILPADEEIELVLIIDQFEELFTLTRDETVRSQFLNALVAAVLEPRSRLRLVITLRADFMDRPLQYVDFGELLRQRTEFVLPLTPDELEQAIFGPARRVGVELESGLVAAISRDVDQEPGALPLLQYALTELFERSTLNVEGFAEAPLLTRAAYQASGGVLGALARRADETYNELDAAGQEAARQLFLRLVTLGEGAEDTRRRVLRAEVEALAGKQTPSLTLPLPGGRDSSSPSLLEGEGRGGGHRSPVIDQVIDQFGKHRLLSFDHDPITRGPTVEVAHEALLREWGRLREWLDASRTDIRMQRLLAIAAAEWHEAGQDASFLLRGTRLDQFAGWVEITTLALTPDERAFLEVSLADREARRAEEEVRQRRELETVRILAETERARAVEQSRSARRLRWLALGLALFLIAAIGAALLALQQTNRAEQEADRAERAARLATARELAAAALANMELDPERSVLLALQAITTTYAVDGSVLREAEEALHQAIPASRVQLTLTGHTDWVNAVTFSPDGLHLASASNDHTAKIWDSATGQELITLTGHTGGVGAVAFSPDGLRLATASNDKSVKLWDAVSGQELMTLAGHSLKDTLAGTGGSTGHFAAVVDVAFSPDGTRLATAGLDRRAIIWDAAAGASLLTLADHTDLVNEVAFSPDGTRLATASDDFGVIVWDAASGEAIFTLSGHTGRVKTVAFSPDGRLIASGGEDATARVWNANTGREVLVLTGHPSAVTAVAFSPDGSQLAAVGLDQTVVGWDLATRRQLWRLAGHTRGIWDVTFSPAGTRLASASEDHTAKIWDVTPGQERLTLSQTELIHEDAGGSVFSPAGDYLATVGPGGQTVILRDAITGQEELTLAGHSGWIWDMAFSRDGRRLATASGDNTVRIWDTTNGQAQLVLTNFSGSVRGLALSPDGTRLATASDNDPPKIWDSVSGQELLSLSGHTAGIQGLTFSPDGTRLATASQDNTARVWDAASGQLLDTLTGHTGFVNDVAFSPDGTQLATSGGDTTVKLWDAATGQELHTLAGHTGFVLGLAYSPNGTRLATAGGDGSVKLWNTATGQETLTLTGGYTAFNDVSFSPDGVRLATTNFDGTTRVYVLPIEELVALAQSRVTRSLTEAECRQYLHGEKCPGE